jgi:hypothetical protein
LFCKAERNQTMHKRVKEAYANRLTNVAFKNTSGQVTQTVDYVYDAFNQLIKRIVDSDGALGSNAIDQTFNIYDGGQIEVDPVGWAPIWWNQRG